MAGGIQKNSWLHGCEPGEACVFNVIFEEDLEIFVMNGGKCCDILAIS